MNIKTEQSSFYQLTAERDHEIILCLQPESKPWRKIWDNRKALAKAVGITKGDFWRLVVRKITPQPDAIFRKLIIKEDY